MMVTGDKVSTKFPLVKLAAYLHDCGKPIVYDKERRFLRHDVIGADRVRLRLRELCFSNSEVEIVTGLVRTHMFSFVPESAKSVRRFVHKLALHAVSYSDWLRLRIADHAANLKTQEYSVSDLKHTYVRPVFEINKQQPPLDAKQLPVKGGELIDIFGLEPGPIVTAVQKELVAYCIETGDCGRYSLLEVAANYLATVFADY